MPAPATVDEFVDLIRKSAVLEEVRLAAYVEKLRSDPAAPKDISSIAGLFVRDGLLTFFQAEQFLQGKWKRFTIGKYKVLERLGSRGMGQVFLCEHKLMRRRVAVKVLPTQKATDPSSLERFYREARAVAALDHPNIVRAYDIDQDDNLHFLVMEYVDGASLQEMIRRTGPMDPTRACHYMYWSAVGLQHAHAQGLIHRDIKPGNILVDRTGVVKILDLGLARFFNDDEDLLTKKYDESVLGTADYLAPEQAVDSHTVDGRADIYSLGATFYFLLTGQPPFAEGTVAQKLLWHQSKNPKPVREVRGQIPEAVARVVARMMAKKPEDRYQSPCELADALLPFTQTPIPPPPDEEMPTLSAAAQGVSSGPASVPAGPPPRAGGLAPRTPRPVPNPKGTVTAHRPAATKPPPAPAPRGSNGVPVSDADTQKKATPAPVVEPIPDPAAAAPIWEAISAETANASRADTDRKKREASSRRIKPDPKSSPKAPAKSGRLAGRRRPPLPLVLTIVGGLLLVGAALFAVYWFFLRGPKQTPPPQPRRLVVAKTGQFPTVQKAVDVALAGDTIAIEDPEVEESVAVSRIKNLTITAADGNRVLWRAPANRTTDYLLSLGGMEGARVTGITFDGAQRADNAVRLGGPCPGLVLDNVEMLNARSAPLALHDCTGDKGHPVTIKNCRIATPTGKAGVLFTANPSGKANHPAPGSQSVLIDNCLIEGPVGGPGVLFEGSATVEVLHSRLWRGASGVQFRRATERPPSELLWVVTLSGNTFHSQTAAGIWVEDGGQFASRPENRLSISQNFFAGSPVAIKVDGGDPTQLKFLAVDANNVRKSGTAPVTPGNVPLPPITETASDVLVDANNPSRPLAYDKAHPPILGPNGKPVGAPPE
jgi:eukaryotic-like serine/threonine-protein kinase